MKQLNLAIIGQGRSGRDIHGKHLLQDTKRFKVVAIVDEIANRRERASKEFGCDVYSDYKELFARKDIDFVVNASFSHQHTPITIDLLNHGFNVLCEKPAGKVPEDVDAMIEASKKNNKMLAFFQQSRFAPYFEQIKSVIESGVLGRLIQITINFNGYARRWDWQCCQDFNAGSLYNTGPHPVDQALNLLDYYNGTPNVLCKMDSVNTFGDAEDYVKLILTAPDRPLIDVEISSCDAYSDFTYKIHGERGGLKGTMTQIDWKYFCPEEAPEQHLIKTPLMNEEGLPLYCSEKLIWIEQSWKAPDSRVFSYAVKKFYDTVYDHLTEGKPLVITPEQVKQQIYVMNECHKQNPMPKMK